MLRLFRSVLKTADRLAQVGTSGATGHSVRLKPLNNLITSLRSGTASAKHTLSSSTTLAGHSVHAGPHYHGASNQLQSSFTLNARQSLGAGRPLMSGMSLPRPPVLPRTTMQVGLGTARNFSSSRHVFQNLVENVPVVVRATWEAEWDLKVKRQQERRMRKGEERKVVRIKDKAKMKENVPAVARALSVSSEEAEENSVAIEKYFARAAEGRTGAVEGAKTILTIPLYPTAEREPLPVISESLSLLPTAEIRDTHHAHEVHSKRIKTIFRRLDTANVWTDGVECHALGAAGLTTSLQVVFDGWTKEMVMGVLGEAGKGWCAFEEHLPPPRVSSPLIPEQVLSPTMTMEPDIVSASFVLPTLDFSSSFIDHGEAAVVSPPPASEFEWSSPTTRATSPGFDFLSDEEFSEPWSDGYSSGEELHVPEIVPVSSLRSRANQVIAFSADFLAHGPSHAVEAFETF